MILRKPYGFLIKHFRLIHILLTILMVFTLYEVSGIVDFYTSFVSNGYTTTISLDMAGNYVPFILFFVLFLILLILLSMIILLRQKSKPTRTYIMCFLYYFILFVGVILSFFLIDSLNKSLWPASSARTYRDVSQILRLPQYLFIILIGIRALGFDVKKFNFKKDLIDLELNETDSEEVEVNFNFDTSKAKRNLRRLVRETKYYYLENKFMIFLTLGAILVVLLFLGFKRIEKLNAVYDEGRMFSYDSYSIKIKDSMITNVDLHGKKIDRIDKDKIFLLIKIEITNNALYDRKLSYNSIKLLIDNDYYTPTLDIGSYFVDYGNPYMNNVLSSKASNVFIIPYVIPMDKINKEAKISIFNGTSSKKDSFAAKKIIINLSPKEYFDAKIVQSVDYGNPVYFEGSLIGDSSLNITNYELTTKYVYKYESCYNDNCRMYTDYATPDNQYMNKLVLLVMDYDYKLSDDIALNKNINTIGVFANAFMQVSYEKNGVVKVASVKNITPTNLKDKLILQVDNGIMDADKVSLLTTIRNRIYEIRLKNS